MNELFYALIMIIIIIVLILAFVLISYFYNNYTENKDKVNLNFKKTSTYINDTNNTILKNISAVDNKYNGITSKTISDLTSLTNNFNSTKQSFSSNLQENSILNANTSSNVNKLDNNLRNYFEFRNNNTSINQALFNYNFGVTPNLSLALLQRVDAASGMTIQTDARQRSFHICDYENSNSCIDLNVKDGNFNISGTVNNLNIKKPGNGRVLANFDFNSNSIYLGGTGEDAGLYINENNVYLKNLNLLSNNTKFNDAKVMYNSITPTQPFNTYSYNLEDVKKINNFMTQPSKLIIGNYSLSNILLSPDNAPGTLLDIYIKSKFLIPAQTSINIELFEINIPAGGSVSIYNSLSGTPIESLTIEGKNATAKISSEVPANRTVQFRYSGSLISINTASFPSIPINRAFISDF